MCFIDFIIPRNEKKVIIIERRANAVKIHKMVLRVPVSMDAKTEVLVNKV
jgi:hypothetical protein